MQDFRSIRAKGFFALFLILMTWATNSAAGELTLAWDPNTSVSGGADLIGYNLYYNAGSSVAADQDGADLIYIPLSEPGFDPDHPRYHVTGLTDSEQYYFVVTAMYGDDESGMSNEVLSTVSGTSGGQNSSINAGTADASAGSSSGGCFIDSLQ